MFTHGYIATRLDQFDLLVTLLPHLRFVCLRLVTYTFVARLGLFVYALRSRLHVCYVYFTFTLRFTGWFTFYVPRLRLVVVYVYTFTLRLVGWFVWLLLRCSGWLVPTLFTRLHSLFGYIVVTLRLLVGCWVPTVVGCSHLPDSTHFGYVWLFTRFVVPFTGFTVWLRLRLLQLLRLLRVTFAFRLRLHGLRLRLRLVTTHVVCYVCVWFPLDYTHVCCRVVPFCCCLVGLHTVAVIYVWLFHVAVTVTRIWVGYTHVYILVDFTVTFTLVVVRLRLRSFDFTFAFVYG